MIGSEKRVSYTAIAELIVASMVAAWASLTMVLSKLGMITRPAPMVNELDPESLFVLPAWATSWLLSTNTYAEKEPGLALATERVRLSLVVEPAAMPAVENVGS